MNEELAMVIAETSNAPEKHPDLTLRYIRGHEMSGMIEFRMTSDGRYELSHINRYGKANRFSGEMDAPKRAAIFGSAQINGLLEIPSSTDIAPEDDIPTIVDVACGDLAHHLYIGDFEETRDSAFEQFEADLQTVFDDLSEGAITAATIPRAPR